MSRAFCILCLVAALACACLQAQAAEAVGVRRVYVPASEPEKWPTAGGRFLPIDAESFARWEQGARQTAAAPAVRLIAAEYQAVFNSPNTLAGRASFVLHHAGGGERMLPLSPFRLAVRAARWQGADKKPARLVTDSEGRSLVAVEQSGTLEVEWSLGGEAADGVVGFPIGLPNCARNRWSMDLPAGLVPSLDRALASARPAAATGRTAWTLQWSGEAAGRLVLAPGNVSLSPTFQVRQTTVYEVSIEGVDISAQFEYTAAGGQPIDRLRFAIDPGLQILSVRRGEERLRWSAVDVGGQSEIVVELSATLGERDDAIRVRAAAVAPLDRPWRLPRVAPQGALWVQGSATLVVPAPVVLRQMKLEGCRQSGVAPLPAPRRGEAVQLECFSADAAIEVAVERQRPRARLTSLAAVQLRPSQMTAEVLVDVRLDDGELFALTAPVAAGWAIDAIESTPEAMIDDWNVEGAAGALRLNLSLGKALTAARPLQLKILARRIEAVLGKKFELDRLVPLRFAEDSRRLVALLPADPFELRLEGTELLDRVAVEGLAAAERELLSPKPPVLVVADDGRSALLRATIEPRRPGHTARIAVEVTAAAGQLVENYRLSVSPQSSRLSRVLVRLPQKRTPPLVWSLGSDGPPLVARVLPGATEPLPAAEVWEVELDRPRSETFEIVGRREGPWTGETPLALASVPEASDQEATLAIRAVGGPRAVAVQNRRLERIAPAVGAAGPPLVACYRYDPRREAAISQPAIVLARSGSDLSGVWAWDLSVETRLAGDGRDEHVATFRLQNDGQRQLSVRMPAAAERSIVGVTVDGSQAAWRQAGEDEILVDLGDAPTATLAIRYLTEGAALRAFDRRSPPLLQPDCPVLTRSWRVWLPPGYEAEVDRAPAAGALLGPLAADGDGSSPPLAADEHPGWTGVLVSIAPGRQTSIAVVHRPTRELARWSLFIVAGTLGAWLLPGRLSVLLAALVGVVALGAAPAWAWAASAVFLAALLVVVHWLAREAAPTTSAPLPLASVEPGSTLSGGAVPGGLVVLLVGAMLAGSWVDARGAEPGKTYDVLVPTDAEGRPQKTWYVAEPLFGELARRAGRDGWRAAAAAYRARLKWHSLPGRLELDRLDASFEIDAGGGDRIELPFVRSEVELLEATVDGRPAPVDWRTDGKAAVFSGFRPGANRLVVQLQPTAPADAAGIEIAVPPVAGARLEVTMPPGIQRVEAPSALGAIAYEEQPRRMIAELGPAARLVLRWPAAKPDAGPGDVEERLWLRVQPGSIVLDAKWKLAAPVRLRQLRVAADPRLKLLPAAGETKSPAVEVDAGDPQVFRIAVPPGSGPAVVAHRFLLTGSAPAGNVQLPFLQLADVRPQRRALAVSIDPAYSYQQRAAAGVEPLSVPEFLGEWGEAETSPQLVYRLPPHEIDEWPAVPALTIATRPRPPQTTLEQTVSASFDSQGTQLECVVRLETLAGYCFQHRFVGPPGLVVDRASLVEDSLERVSRWSTAPDGTVTIFFSAPVTGAQTLTLRGRLPAARGGPQPLPILRVADAQTRASALHLYRQGSVRVRVESLTGATATTAPPTADPLMGHWLKSYILAEDARGQVVVSPNRPKLASRQTMTVRADGARWQAVVDFALEASGGVVDTLLIEFPSPLAAPVELQPPAEQELLDANGGHRLLAVRLREPLSGAAPLRLVATIKTSPAEPVTVAPLRLRDSTSQPTVVVLPAKRGSEPLAWETTGLKRLDTSATAEAATYEAADDFRAVLKTTAAGGGATAALADLRWSVEGGEVLGLAVYAVEPGTATDFVVELPDDCRLLRLVAAGQPLAPATLRSNRYRAAFPFRRLPQAVEILYSAPMPPVGERELPLARLAGVPPRKTIAAVYATPARLTSAAKEIGPADAAIDRAHGTLAILEEGLGHLGATHDDLATWFATWTPRLRRLEAEAAASLPGEASDATAQAERRRAERAIVGDRLEQLYESMRARGVARQAAPSPATDQARPFEWTRPAVHFAVSGQWPRIGIAAAARPARRVMSLPLALAVLAGFAVALRPRPLERLVRPRPELLALLVGGAWWLWMWPSAVGLAVAGLGIVAGMVGRLRNRRD